MRVLQVIDKSFLGGGQMNVRNLLAAFRGSEVETLLACRDGGPLVDWARSLDTPFHPIPFDKRFRTGPARRLAGLAREHGVDLVHSHGLVATFYCALARLLFGLRAPVLYHQHGFHHHNYGPLTIGLRKRVEIWVCHRVQEVIASSRSDRSRLEEGGYAPAERIVLLHNGIPEPVASQEEIEEVRSALACSDASPLVGIIARLHPQKGIDTFLRAAARVRQRAPATRFVVVGSGELEAELRSLANDLGLGSSLVWTGPLPSRAVHAFLHVAVVASRWEGLPIVLLEFMAAGRPIVSTAAGGCLEAIGPEQAEIVPVDDDEAMSQAMLRLLRDPSLAKRRGVAARQRFEEHFTLDVISRELIGLYRKHLP